MILNDFDRDTFLRDYWQQQPLLIKQSGTGFVDPLTADELAGLACEPDMESRLVTRSDGNNWQLTHGPLNPDRFTRLGETNWTLLVQAVDQVDPGVNDLKQYFDFLPAWRIDDIMVSYACDGGGVGPHYDQYDVFLLQGQGKRVWQIGQRCDDSTPLRTDTPLSILESFSPQEEFLLEPGDILYLPPRIAHHGVSRGASLCYSVGFRAPSVTDLVQDFADVLAGIVSDDERFVDPHDSLRGTTTDSSEIYGQAVSSAQQLVAGWTGQQQLFRDVLGAYATRPRYPERIQPPATQYREDDLHQLFNNDQQAAVFTKNSCSRFFYSPGDGRVFLYVDETVFPCALQLVPLVQRLCSTPWHEPLTFSAAEYAAGSVALPLLVQLLNQGSLQLVPPADDQEPDE